MVHSLDLLCRNYSCSCFKASQACVKGWNHRRLDTLSMALTGCIVCTARSYILLQQ
jgi:ABC-type Mn2+/Zn2+ transport system permease subunit